MKRATHPLIFGWLLMFIAAAPANPYLLHLPGIGGHMRIDDLLTTGLMRGAIDAQIEIYDWTKGNPGMPALTNYERNRLEAKNVTDLLVKVHRADPSRRIMITCHSGGGGIAIWALEQLPDDVQIDTLLMVASALSPEYDLSNALRHVRGHAYAFNSVYDPILSFGTRNFGTMDRVMGESAGFSGFIMPAGADKKQYAKLVQVPYDASWMRLGNAGDHIGAMNVLFARTIIAPLLLTGQLPKLPSTQPSTQSMPLTPALSPAYRGEGAGVRP
ncbi:MAG TPA: hypothetical protein VHD56_10205 [Tepidisphaeraceae bacterium]|nr:hypothetical protein [Tepidisphaeraceae bacterium]